MYEYKVLDGHVIAKKGKNFAQTLENLLNEMQAEGWEFYCQSDITESIHPGCLNFLGKPEVKLRQTFIFRRTIKEEKIDDFKEEHSKPIDILKNPKKIIKKSEEETENKVNISMNDIIK